jgi:hypothetical protein
MGHPNHGYTAFGAAQSQLAATLTKNITPLQQNLSKVFSNLQTAAISNAGPSSLNSSKENLEKTVKSQRM